MSGNSVLANYALGKACHDMKADDQAFSHWREANTRFRKQIGYHPDEDVKIFDQIRAWADQPRTVEPDPHMHPPGVYPRHAAVGHIAGRAGASGIRVFMRQVSSITGARR